MKPGTWFWKIVSASAGRGKGEMVPDWKDFNSLSILHEKGESMSLAVIFWFAVGAATGFKRL